MFFLKYRPQTIEDLDLKDVRRELKKILKQDSIPHAFLFAGPKGTGKTSAARILAKSVNCSESKDFEPCNDCEVCREITNGTSLDVVEVDAASNRGIDDIRDLKEKIGLAPIKAKYKVYIIDEVHMLTNQAFNALLKTLEEPPSHVIFVLCTTDPDKIIPTVMSRLMRIDFHRGSTSEVKRSLEKVVKGEKLKVDDKVINEIVQLSEGGFRDGQKILENLVLNLGKKIKWSEAKNLLGHFAKRKPETVLDFLSEGKLNEIVKISEDLAEEGASFRDYLKKLLSLIQKLILVKSGVEKDKQLVELAEKFEISELVELSDNFSEAVYRQKNSLLPQLPFQLGVIKYLKGRDAEKHKRIKVENKSKNTNKNKGKTMVKEKRPTRRESSKQAGKGAKNKDIDLKEIEKKWEELLKAVKPMNHSVAAFLKAARPKKIDGNYLILEVFYPFHKDKLEEHRNRQIVEQGLEKITNSYVKIKCVLGNKKDDLYNAAKDIFK